MKSFMAVSLLALMVATAAFGAPSTSRTLPNMGPANSTGGTIAPDGPADVFIASSTNGGTFTNLAPNYATAFTAAGAASVTQITDGALAPFTFPVPFTSTQFGTIAILTNENWWGSASTGQAEANCSLADEAKISAYMDTGGHMLFSGQDYLFARGNGSGFPQIYLGISSYVDDVNFDDTSLNFTGVPGGAIAGLAGSMTINGAPCWSTANNFYTDGITPFGLGLVNWNSTPSGTSGQGGTTWDTGAFRTVFTGVEFACGSTAQFNADVASIYNFLRGSSTSVDPSTWGQVKTLYSGR
jgi:hypothetical protein